ncbi:hypothetical protein TIFTF001_003038 [Ficus carica]|uniref:Uncharacterized protein n=1 Tax=Ficus carica TaxID=3494 RepID=A0AA87ZFR5_FICCA|nr:hypothetical protein TIFTF001_003038 [Ficus carica]
MATSCKKVKEVIVTRHVERPSRVVANHHHHHHHHHPHHVHHTVKGEVIHYRHGAEGKRFINRRAELLQYSQDLRQSARPPAPPLPLPNPSNNRTPETKVIHIRRNSKDGRNPTCLGNCKTTIPNFFKLLSLRTGKERNKKTKSFTTGNKITALKKSLQVQKQRGIFSKLFLTSRKDR